MDMSNVTNSLVQSQLANAALYQQINTKVAAKAMDIAKVQGEAAISLLDSAAQIAKAANTEKPTLTLGALASGLGQNLDVCG
ncbi:MAG: hypothetical protein JW936_08320 [Sedimentisphaerales bacterium]|nr:hypothetical protein [Sedimentisphaerales bacterium]